MTQAERNLAEKLATKELFPSDLNCIFHDVVVHGHTHLSNEGVERVLSIISEALPDLAKEAGYIKYKEGFLSSWILGSGHN